MKILIMLLLLSSCSEGSSYKCIDGTTYYRKEGIWVKHYLLTDCKNDEPNYDCN